MFDFPLSVALHPNTLHPTPCHYPRTKPDIPLGVALPTTPCHYTGLSLISHLAWPYPLHPPPHTLHTPPSTPHPATAPD
jgi:hypothetical protein